MKAYVVKGSEDGTIGVYSSKARAIVAAKEYVSNAEENPETTFNFYSYLDNTTVSADWSWVSAEIEKFEMNA